MCVFGGGGRCVYTWGWECKSENNAEFYNRLGRNTAVEHVQNLGENIFEWQENWAWNIRCYKKELRLKNMIHKDCLWFRKADSISVTM